MTLVVRRYCIRGGELYCYNTEGDRHSVVSCRMDVTQLEQRVYSGLWTLWEITLKVYAYEYGIF
jgi:hypothetical protein